MRTEMRLAPGQQRTGAIVLANRLPQSVRVRGRALDFSIDDAGSPQFEPVIKSESDSSCARWLSLNPVETELAPESQQAVRYTIRVPREAATGGFHCAVGYVTLPPPEPKSTAPGMGLQTLVQMVSALYVVTGEPDIQGGLKEIKLERDPDKGRAAWRAVVLMGNPGTVHYRPTGSVVLLDRSGRELETQEFMSLPVLPKREQRFLFPLKSTLEAGEKYRLRVQVDIGTPEIQEGTVDFEAPPQGQ